MLTVHMVRDHAGNGLFVAYYALDAVTGSTARRVLRPFTDISLLEKLPDLACYIICSDKDRHWPDRSTLRHFRIPCQDHATLPLGRAYKVLVSNMCFIEHIKAEHPEPSGKPAEHGIGYVCRVQL